MEEGVDDGGLTTDLYGQFFTRIFDAKYGYFESTSEAVEVGVELGFGVTWYWGKG